MPEKGSIQNFEDLECWKACRELRLFIAQDILSMFPSDERYRLGDQIIRAARSATANIAEGYGRFHFADNAKFCALIDGQLLSEAYRTYWSRDLVNAQKLFRAAFAQHAWHARDLKYVLPALLPSRIFQGIVGLADTSRGTD